MFYLSHLILMNPLLVVLTVIYRLMMISMMMTLKILPVNLMMTKRSPIISL
ncbi:hypothetical protein HanXRQr2_Chr02g0048331 [Helianthus annuus]|uniref:Uncharacterized protein n=1 Tax=Helianthus annuus TaxID=4232 RepID=A0A9K3JM83_HELAN|nr:hypothetical protein HanXRQr2_Chr02g0048331 [Helianthus annuus]